MSDIEVILGYRFKNGDLLTEALTHSSCGQPRKDYERLEFLGDSILSMVVSSVLFRRIPVLSESGMTLVRKGAIREETLAAISRRLGIGPFLHIAKSEEKTGVRVRTSVLADVMEALIAAIYIDGGLNAATDFISRNFSEWIAAEPSEPERDDHKTKLQEILQSRNMKPEYKVITETGPDHKKIFESEISVNGVVLGKGIGSTKKESEQNAAKYVLDNDSIQNMTSGD